MSYFASFPRQPLRSLLCRNNDKSSDSPPPYSEEEGQALQRETQHLSNDGSCGTLERQLDGTGNTSTPMQEQSLVSIVVRLVCVVYTMSELANGSTAAREST